MREDWIAIARKTLVTAGIDDVKVDRLAKRLGVTRGSFYWHFQSRSDLLQALLKDWEARNLVEIAQVEEHWTSSGPELSDVVRSWMSEDSAFLAFDLAVRGWARKAPSVAKAVHRVDDAWIALLEEVFRHSGYGGDEALVRARIVYFHQIGYYALDIRETLEERVRLIPIYYEALLGKKPNRALDTVLSEILATKRSRRGRAA